MSVTGPCRKCDVAPVLLDRPCGSGSVQLVRVVEHGGLGRSRAAGVVMNGDRVEQLGPHLGSRAAGTLLDQP